MEALGVASGVAGLISLADVVAFKISRYYNLFKSSKSDIRELLLEVQSLYGVLNSLKLLAQCLEEAYPTTGSANMAQMDHFQTCRKNLDYLKRSLSKLDSDSSKPLVVVKTRLLWPFKSEETKELVKKISRNKSDLADALTADGLTALVNALSSQERLLDSVETLQKQVQKLAIEKAENEQDETRKKIFDWCSTVNPYKKHRTAKSLRHPNTVLWFFESEEWQNWLEEPDSAIWLYGIPGAGKTILTSAVIEEAKRMTTDTIETALAYYYCEYRTPETQKLSNILGSLVRQLAGTSDDAFQELESFYEKCNPYRKDPIIPNEEELGQLLGRASRCFDSVMVVVDGLDEISDPEERSQILEFLSSLNNSAYGPVKCVYTSRDEIDIREQFTLFKSISIAARGNDLELYVAAVIETRMQSRTLRIKDPSLKETIINGIVSKANGMFQYAKCQLDYLCTLSTDRERRNALATLPADLFETYKRILMRVSKSTRGNQRLVERTLRWVALAGGNLEADAYATAVAVEIGTEKLDPDDLPDEHSILRWCSSLVTKDDRLNTLSFSHFTVREFLEDPKLLEINDLKEFYLDWETSHCIIAKVCLTYLCMPEFSHWVVNSYEEIRPRLEKLPLLKYACQWWNDHGDASRYKDGIINDTTLFHLICRLFHPMKTSNFILWVQVYWALWQEHDGLGDDALAPISATPLHHAAMLGYVNVCTWLLGKGEDVNAFDSLLGTPLLCAVTSYHIPGLEKLNVLRTLLRYGAHGGDEIRTHRSILRNHELPFGTPMSMVLDHAKERPDYACEMFRELLTSFEVSTFGKSSFWAQTYGGPIPGPPPPFRPPIPMSPMSPLLPPAPRRTMTWERSECKATKMVELFREALNHKASSLIDEESKSKMLSYLVENGKNDEGGDRDRDQVLSIQLIRANMATSTISGQVALTAAKNGQVELIQAYINERRDAFILARCLPFAASAGYFTIVDKVLDYALPQISLESEDVQQAWINSAAIGSIACLSSFVEHGLDPSIIVTVRGVPLAFAPRCGTALAAAVACGTLEAVKYLLGFPGPHLKFSADGLPLLHLAARAQRSRKEIIEVLLEAGLDPTERSHRGSSVLHYLLLNSNDLNSSDLEIARVLVSKGCDLEAIDDEGYTLLHALLSWPSYTATCFSELKDLIIGQGHMKFHKSKDGTLPLQLAIKSRQPRDIIRTLIPADVTLWNCASQRYFSPLHEAVSVGILQMNLKGYDLGPRTRAPRGLVDNTCDISTLEMMLNIHGVDINVRDELGNTPLSTHLLRSESYNGRHFKLNLLRLLLRSGAEVNVSNDRGVTPLMMMVRHGLEEDLKLILSYKPDLIAQTKLGDTAFHLVIATSNQTLESFGILLDYAKTISNHLEGNLLGLEIANNTGSLPVHLACERENSDVLRYLLDFGYVPDVNVRTKKGRRTPLHFVARWDNNVVASPIILELINLGADVNAIDAERHRPIHVAAKSGNLEILKTLIESGAQTNVKNSSGYTPWMCAALGKHSKAVAYLKKQAELEILAGSNPPSEIDAENSDEDEPFTSSSEDEDEGESSHGMTTFEVGQRDAMKKAVRNSDEELCKALLEAAGADPDLPLTNKYRETALHRAEKPNIVNLLLKKGARIDSVDVWGSQPIHDQSQEGRSENVKLLFEAGAKLDSRNYWMTTSLHWAAINDHLDTVKTIIKLAESQEETVLSVKGEDTIEKAFYSKEGHHKSTKDLLELRNCNGETVFLAALEASSAKVAQFLLEYGVNVFACDRWGHSALWHACAYAEKSFIEALLTRGLDVNCSTVSGVDCLYNVLDRDVYNQDELTDIAMLLINSGANLASKVYGQSALHLACFTGNLAIVKELLGRVSPHELCVESNFTGTPLWAACFRGHLLVVQALFETGWDFDINAGKKGESPLEAACVQLHWDVANILKLKGAVRTKEIQRIPVKEPAAVEKLGDTQSLSLMVIEKV